MVDSSRNHGLVVFSPGSIAVSFLLVEARKMALVVDTSFCDKTYRELYNDTFWRDVE